MPGSGKTTCLATLLIALMFLGAKVLISSQSNSGATALFDKVIDILIAGDFTDLLSKCLRIRSAGIEEAALEKLQSVLPNGHSHVDVTPYSLASHMDRFIRFNPTHELVTEYKDHQLAKSVGCNPQSKRKLNTVLYELQNEVLENALLVGCTAFVSSGLDRLKYEAEIAVSDEASQATEPDLMMTLAK